MTTLGSADAVSAADDVKIMFDNVSKRYVRQGAPFVALDRVSLAVRDHEFLTVIGPSGCGKSTLMSLAAGLATPSSGTVKIDGEIVDGPSPKRGVIFQQYALFPWLTVRQNVEFGLRIARAPKELRRQRAEELIDSLIEPWIQFFRTIPPLALIPLVIVVAGIGETPKVFVLFLASFLSAVIATLQGVTSVDRTLIDAARVLGAKDHHIFVRVVVPASTPFILVGMRIALGASWATLVAAELVAAQRGLGYRMQVAETYYDLPTIFVSLITIGLLGFVMDRLLLLAGRRVTRWQDTGSRAQ